MKKKRKPKEVVLVERALLENAKAGGSPKSRVYVRLETSCVGYDPEPENPAWLLGDSWEGWSSQNFVFLDGEWFTRDFEGFDHPTTLDRVLAESQLFFHDV